jgi:hypothetical protein
MIHGEATPRSRFVSSLFHDCPSKLPEKCVDIRGTPLSEAAIQSVDPPGFVVRRRPSIATT